MDFIYVKYPITITKSYAGKRNRYSIFYQLRIFKMLISMLE